MNVCRTSLSIARGLTVLLAAVSLAPSSPAYGQNGAIGIAYPAKGIVIDGDLSDWPKDLKTYPIERIEFGDKLSSKEDLKAHFRVAYDASEHALYVAVEVKDNSILTETQGEVVWNSQDSCELFVDANHIGGGSPVEQFARYGSQNQIVSPLGTSEKAMKVGVTRTDSTIVYEWRIETPGSLDPDRVIGFDVSVADKDKDGTFSWAAWGSGTQKAQTPGRCGELFLVTPETKFGEVAGTVAWKEASDSALPSRVRIQSTRTAPLWREVSLDPSGAYEVSMLPTGPYTIHPVDSTELRVEETSHVNVEVEANQKAKADNLRVSLIPWPGLIGDEGILRSSQPVNPEEVDRFVKAYLAYFKIPGMSLSIIKDSKVVYHRGFGLKNTASNDPVAEDTVFEAASMTKPLFAYTVLRLVDRGVLKLDTPLYTYLPYEDIAYDDRYKLITARMVLTHRTGFPNWRTGKLDIKFTPGTKVSYSGEGFVYLGNVVEHLTGKKLVQICEEEVFKPLGVENGSLVWNDHIARVTATGHGGTTPLQKGRPSSPNVAASLHIDAQNYAKFLISVLQGKGLSDSTHKDMLRSQIGIPDEPKNFWGLGIAIEDTPVGRNYGHGGRNTGFTSHSLMYKDQGFGYVLLVNNDDAMKIANVVNAFLITGKSGLRHFETASHKLAKVDPKLYDAYAGRYELEHEVIITLTRDGNHLFLQPTGEGKFEIFPESETAFFIKQGANDLITFVKDDQGKVTHAVVREGGHDVKAKRLADDAKAEATK